jgi:tetratricopeptide (TPR) repeat protein
VGLGSVLAQLGDKEAAITAWRAASEREPTDFSVQQYLGWSFFDIGAWEASVQALEHALAASPSPAEARAIEHKLQEARSRATSKSPSRDQ